MSTTTSTTYTTQGKLASLSMLSFLKHDNENNVYNKEKLFALFLLSCKDSKDRKKIAHCAQNVNFAANNVKRRYPSNRSRKAWRGAENALARHCLGDRNYGLGDRKSCRPNSDSPIAISSTRRRGHFSRFRYRFFKGIN